MTRSLPRPCALAATVAAILAALAVGAAGASAETFGGLGIIGENKGETRIHRGDARGDIEIGTSDAFALEPDTGDFYVADQVEVEEGKKTVELTRIQKFDEKGEALAQTLLKLPNAHELELRAVALDAERHELYVLIDGYREGKKYDNNKAAAVEILAVSTQPDSEGELEYTTLAEPDTLGSYSDKPKAALLEPEAIAVDPVTHDILISAQQDEDKSETKEELRAVIQRIHVEETGKTGALKATLGPRYVDSQNCLDEGAAVAEEPACEGLNVENPVSLIATQGGRALVEKQQEEIWEVPITEDSSGPFKEVKVVPRLRFTLPTAAAEQAVVKGFSGVGDEEQSDTLAYAASGSGEGYIYAGIEMRIGAGNEGRSSGVMVLKAREQGGALSIGELGWTGGASATSNQKKCKVPVSNEMPLEVAGSGGQVDVFTGLEVLEGGKTVTEPVIARFGSSGTAEACGHVSVTAPTIKIGEGEIRPSESVDAGPKAKATLSSKVEGADALESSWKIVRRSPAGAMEEEKPLTSSEYLGKETAVKFTFAHTGEYEVIETVTTDDIASPPIIVERKVKATLEPIAVKVEPVSPLPPEGFLRGATVKFEVKLTDPDESEPLLKLTWRFGDGTSESREGKGKPEGTKGIYTAEIEHTFKSTCSGACSVVLEATDALGAEGKAQTAIKMSKRLEEEEEAAKRKAEEAKRKAEEEANKRKAEEEANKRKAEEEAAKRKAEEEARNKVLGEQVVHNPEAKLAGSASLAVAPSGVLTVKVSCPPKESECLGTATLQVEIAKKAGRGKPKKVSLTLAHGDFSVAGGATKALTLHLSNQARAMLAHGTVVHATLKLVAHDSANVTRKTTSAVTLRLATKKGAKSKH